MPGAAAAAAKLGMASMYLALVLGVEGKEDDGVMMTFE